MKLEIINCRCGATIAACHHSAIDDNWTNKKEEYIRRGYTTEIITEEFRFGECSCKDNWNSIMKEFIRETDYESPTSTDLIVWLEENYNTPIKKIEPSTHKHLETLARGRSKY